MSNTVSEQPDKRKHFQLSICCFQKMEYVYEEEMEAAYRVSLLKSFNKTLDNGYFPMVIIDAVNDKVGHSVNSMWTYLSMCSRYYIVKIRRMSKPLALILLLDQGR